MNKRLILLSVLLMFIGGLSVARIWIGSRFDDRLLAFPKTSGLSGPAVDKIEEFQEEEAPLTYEITRHASIQALQSTYEVTLVGTNYAYPRVSGYHMRSGSFFTQKAQEEKSTYAVLNEKAAFDLFGVLVITGNQLRLGQTLYTSVGVIDDKDKDNCNIYLPATIAGGSPSSLIALLREEDGHTEEYIKNQLKTIGVTDSLYDFINLGRVSSMINEKLLMALGMAIAVALVFLIKALLFFMLKKIKRLRSLSDRLYPGEILRKQTREPLSLAGLVALICAIAGLIAFYLFKLLESCLAWKSLAKIYEGLGTESFGRLLDVIWKGAWISRGCFWGAGACCVLLLIFMDAIQLTTAIQHDNMTA